MPGITTVNAPCGKRIPQVGKRHEREAVHHRQPAVDRPYRVVPTPLDHEAGPPAHVLPRAASAALGTLRPPMVMLLS
jgi:hypothetical protein